MLPRATSTEQPGAVIVTGGSRGIGAAVASLPAAHGCDILSA